MKTAKNIAINVILAILIILLIPISLVKGSEFESTKYNLEIIGMNITISNKLIDMVSGIKNNDERLKDLKNKEQYEQNYRNIGVLIDAVDNIEENPNKEILVVSQTNSTYAAMVNLNQMSDEDTDKYVELFIQLIKEQSEETQFEITETELIKSNNGNKYINVISTSEVEQKVVNMSMYYTIMNGNLVTISFRYYEANEQPKNEEEQQIIENIEFYEVQRPSFFTTSEAAKIGLGIVFILIIIIFIIIIIVRIKDRKLLNKKEDAKIKRYSKLGGLILFFWSMCFYQILLYIINIDKATKIENMIFYTTTIKIQNIILALIAMYQIYVILKRKQDTPKKYIKSNIAIIISCGITLIRIIYGIISNTQIYKEHYLKQEISMLPYNIIYPLICIIYYIFSKRVQIYYHLPPKEYKEILKQLLKNKLKKQKEEKNQSK